MKTLLIALLLPLAAWGVALPPGAPPIALSPPPAGGGGSGPYGPSSYTANQVLWGNGTGNIQSQSPGGGIIISDSNGTGQLTLAAGGTNNNVAMEAIGTGGVMSYVQGSNLGFQVMPPSGTYVSGTQITVRPGGGSGQASIGVTTGSMSVIAAGTVAIANSGGTQNLQIATSGTQASATFAWNGGAASFAGTMTFSGAFTANGTTAVSLTSVAPSSAHATVQEWFTVSDGTSTRYIPAF